MAARVACFGKLPFHREFLRIGLDTPAAAWVVQWLEQAHVAWSRAGNAPATSPLIRFTAPVERRVVTGIVRQSSDGLRRHPVTLFVETADDLAARPDACEPTWAALAALLDRPYASVAELGTALSAGVPEPAAAPAGADDGSEATWAALAGPAVDTDGARHLALNFVTAARAQAGASSAADGVAFSVPIGDEPGAARRAARWIALFTAAVGRAMSPPVLLLRPQPGMLVACYRPPDGRDLAAVLSDPALAPIDDLAEAWQAWPPPDARLAAGIDALVRGVPGGAAGLVDAMRVLARS